MDTSEGIPAEIGWVYFVQGPDAGLIKIGFTEMAPDFRFWGIQSNSPVPLARLAVVRGNRDKEKTLHVRFAHLRRHAEWFDPAPDLLAYIAEHGRPWPDSGSAPPPGGPGYWTALRECEDFDPADFVMPGDECFAPSIRALVVQGRMEEAARQRRREARQLGRIPKWAKS